MPGKAEGLSAVRSAAKVLGERTASGWFSLSSFGGEGRGEEAPTRQRHRCSWPPSLFRYAGRREAFCSASFPASQLAAERNDYSPPFSSPAGSPCAVAGRARFADGECGRQKPVWKPALWPADVKYMGWIVGGQAEGPEERGGGAGAAPEQYRCPSVATPLFQ